jgi:hypothetical protein
LGPSYMGWMTVAPHPRHAGEDARRVEKGGYQDLSPRRTPKVGLHHWEQVLQGKTASIAFTRRPSTSLKLRG